MNANDQDAPQSAARSRGDRALIGAYEAALAVASELKLEAVLQRIVDLAREVVPSKYAALGVADENGRILEFITSGISVETRAAIGPIPQGHGLLAALIRDGRPLLVPDIAEDPRSVGFPANHPPMRSLMGVPIRHGERTLGDLYLTERLDQEDFDATDLVALQALAAHAAAAIDRAKLYQDIERGRERAEAQRDDLRIILDNLPSGVLICAEDGRIELANSAAAEMIFAAASSIETTSTTDRDLRLLEVDGAPVPTDQLPQTRAFRGEGDRNRQFLLEGWDGRRLPILVQSAQLRGAEGGTPRVVLVMQDVTKLREAEQLKDDFLSLVSHEIRTPLAAIHGGAHLLSKQGDDLEADVRDELLTDIVDESQRLDRMLTNMLSLTAIQAGQLASNAEPVLLGPVVRAATAQVAERSPNHAFSISIPSRLPPVEADPDLLSQVLSNLYENAVKYSPNGGPIVTTAARADGDVVISVIDSGIGIAPRYVAGVFERFRRVGDDQTVRGMGLGLYLSRHLVEAQGGRIWAESPGVGRGSTFKVSLPVAQDWSES